MIQPYDLILFDLDGTLTDPAEGITNSMRYALARMGLPPRSREELVSYIGPPLFDTFRNTFALGDAGTGRAVELYREYYARRGIYENTLYPGIPALLEGLKAAGTILAVATSKAAVFAEQVLQHFNLRGYFASVAGSNLDGTRSGKAEIIAFLLAGFPAVPPQRAVMVGDRSFDILGARANGIASIAVAYGYGSLPELHEAAPTHFAPSVPSLRSLLLK